MYEGEKYAADEHERGALAIFVVDSTEEGSEEDCAEGEHGRDEACYVFGYRIFHYHQFGGKFKEWEYACIEHEAEHGNQPGD